MCEPGYSTWRLFEERRLVHLGRLHSQYKQPRHRVENAGTEAVQLVVANIADDTVSDIGRGPMHAKHANVATNVSHASRECSRSQHLQLSQPSQLVEDAGWEAGQLVIVHESAVLPCTQSSVGGGQQTGALETVGCVAARGGSTYSHDNFVNLSKMPAGRLVSLLLFKYLSLGRLCKHCKLQRFVVWAVS